MYCWRVTNFIGVPHKLYAYDEAITLPQMIHVYAMSIMWILESL